MGDNEESRDIPANSGDANTNAAPAPEQHYAEDGEADTIAQGKSETKETREESPSKGETGSTRLPDWIRKGLTERRNLQTLVRCWAITWAAFLLVIIGPSLRALGQAAFFAAIVTLMVPASMPLALFLLAIFMIVLGACFGWAWACAALAAGLRARDQAFLASQLQRVNSEAQSEESTVNPDQYFRNSIFEGEFLDTRSTAVVGIFFVVGCYLLGVVQAARPKLKIAAIFATILLDINCSYGPLFPTGYYTLGTIFMIPIGCAAGISVAGKIFIFPETLAYGWQLDLVKLLNLGGKMLRTHHEALERIVKESPQEVEAETAPKIQAMTGQIVALSDSMAGQTPFLELEVIYGRLSSRDLKTINEKVRKGAVRIFGLDAFFQLLEKTGLDDSYDKENQTRKSDKDTYGKGSKIVTVGETHSILSWRKQMLRSEAEHNVKLQTLLGILANATRKPLDAANASIDTMSGWINAVARRERGYKHDEWLARLEDTRNKLQESLQTFMDKDRLALIAPYEHMFSESAMPAAARDSFRYSARTLYICFVFASNMSNFVDELLQTHNAVLDIANRRPRNRIWFPTGLRKLGKLLNSKGGIVSGGESGTAQLDQQSPLQDDRYAEDDTNDDDEENNGSLTDEGTENSSAGDTEVGSRGENDNGRDEKSGKSSSKKDRIRSADEAEKRKRKKHEYKNDPDALPPSRAVHHVGRAMSSVYRAWWSPQGVYALRYAIVSFALWIPGVVPSSAHFAYENRSIWALIMAQTAMALTGGEMVFSLAGRLLGTGVGLVLGMLYWYISCGKAARGNAYGLGAVSAVGLLPLVFLRVFAPPSLLMVAIMTGVTTILCIGYSWIDSHLVVQANSGIGVEVAWRRALLVVIGCVASFVVMIFPSPPSTRQSVRLGFAKNTEQIAKLYSTVIEGWIVVEQGEEKDGKIAGGNGSGDKRSASEVKPSPTNTTAEAARKEAVLASIRPRFLISQAILNQLRGDISLASLDLTFRGSWPKAQYMEMHRLHVRLLQAIAQMASALAGLDLHWRRRMLSTTAILDPLTISDISVTLSLLATSLRTGKPLPHAFTSLMETTMHHQGLARSIARNLARSSDGEEDILTLATLRDPLFMKHTAGVMALLSFVSHLDVLRATVIGLVGEHELPGYDMIKDRFDQRLVQANFSFA